MSFDEQKAMADLVAKGIKIPPQPKVLLAFREKLLSGNYDTRSLAKILGQDPGISAMLFKAVRSPVFGRNKALDTLEQVLMIIGVKQTFNLVQAIALSTSIPSGARKALDAFWIRSQEVARIASLVAEHRVSVCNVFPDQAYMAGIFHECGIAVLMQRFPEYCDCLRLDSVCCWPDLGEEDRRFDLDHCTVGYLVARHWKLPDFVCAAIRYHHELPAEEVGAARSLVAIVQMAIHCYHRFGHMDDDVLWKQIRAEVLNELGLADDEENDFCNQIGERFCA